MYTRLQWAAGWCRSKGDLISLRTVSTETRKHNLPLWFGYFFPLQQGSTAIRQIYWWHVWLFQQKWEGAMDQHSHLIPITSHRTHNLSWWAVPDKERAMPTHRYSFPHSVTGESINFLPICTEVFVCFECTKQHCHNYHLPLHQGREMQLLFLPFYFGLQPFLLDFMQRNVNYY